MGSPGSKPSSCGYFDFKAGHGPLFTTISFFLTLIFASFHSCVYLILTGTSKRNILRKGGGFSRVRKARAGSKDMTEDDFDGPAYLDENDPNYDPADDYPPIYHMCNKAMFEKATEGDGLYFSPTYEQDNFIHATEEDLPASSM